MFDTRANKRNVVAFYDLMFNACRPRAGTERHDPFRRDRPARCVGTLTGTYGVARGPSTSRTFRARSSSVKGFVRRWTSRSRVPLWTMALRV